MRKPMIKFLAKKNPPPRDQKKGFTVINEAFVCKNCGFSNPRAPQTCRNHCKKCLYSKHLDEKSPGDRLSSCQALMKPNFVDYKGKKGYIIVHECLGCGCTTPNKLASDDDFEMVIKISKLRKP